MILCLLFYLILFYYHKFEKISQCKNFLVLPLGILIFILMYCVGSTWNALCVVMPRRVVMLTPTTWWVFIPEIVRVNWRMYEWRRVYPTSGSVCVDSAHPKETLWVCYYSFSYNCCVIICPNYVWFVPIFFVLKILAVVFVKHNLLKSLIKWETASLFFWLCWDNII